MEEIDLTQGTIVIAVKPQVVENILIALRGKLTSETTIISIVAGYSTKDIRNYIGMEQTKTKLSQVLKESITGKAIVILLGSIVIGYIIGDRKSVV